MMDINSTDSLLAGAFPVQPACEGGTEPQARNPAPAPSTGTAYGDIERQDVMAGAAFLAVGGGGPRDLGGKILKTLSGCQVPVVQAADIADDAWVVCSAYLGSPIAASHLTNPTFDSLKRCIEALQASSGITVDYVVPGEMGAVNTVAPFLAAHDLGIPLIDADGCGRAVPLIAATSFGQDASLTTRHGAAIANDANDASLYQTAVFHATNTNQIQAAAGAVIGGPAYGLLGAIAMWLMTGAELKALAVVGGITRAHTIGKALREASQSGGDCLATLKSTLETLGMKGRVLFDGRTLSARAANIATKAIHDKGKLIFDVSGSDGEVFTVDTFNENIIAYSNRETAPVISSPDMLCWMQPDGHTLDNSELQAKISAGTLGDIYAIGVEATQLIGTDAIANRHAFRDDPGIRAMFQSVVAKAGFSGEYLPFKA